MIQKINQRVEFNSTKNNVQKNNINKNNMAQMAENPIAKTSFNPKLLQKYYVSFTSKMMREERAEFRLSPTDKKRKELEQHYTQETIKLIDAATEIAKKHRHKEVTGLHIFKATLESLTQYIDDLDSGVKTYNSNSPYKLPYVLEEITTDELFAKEEYRKLIKPILEEEIVTVNKLLLAIPSDTTEKNKTKKPITLKLSDEVVNNAFTAYSAFKDDDGSSSFTESQLVGSLLDAEVEKTDNLYSSFEYRIQDAIMVDHTKPEARIHLNTFDNRAQKVLKNLSLGTNMFITYENKSNPEYFVNSIIKVFNNPNSETEKINKENTSITIFNKNLNQGFFVDKAKQLAKNKNHNHIFIMDLDKMLENQQKQINLDADCDDMKIDSDYNKKFVDFMKNPPKNVKLVFIQDKDKYFKNLQTYTFQKLFENFGEISFPVMSAEQAKKVFREQPLLMEKIDVQFSKKAIDKVVEAAEQLDGQYPQKAQRLIKLLASYYIDKKEISEKDVVNYVKEAKDLFKTTNDGSAIEVIFDTGKRIKDIMGKESTKKEATGIVKQIKNKTLGTKGAIIYSADGSPGSGRRHTAKAIAGEAKSPYIQINALDFGTKDVDLFGGEVLSPEASIKKLFSLVTTQAEANPNKSAVLFIENFEYFSMGEMVSEYHQKAMSQVLREMDKSEKKGLNVLILGSVNNPDLIGESTMKSSKFIDSIEISSPSNNLDARIEILERFIKENKIKIAGLTESDKKSVIKLAAETVDGFPFLYLKNLVNKAKTVATERGHKELDKSDFTEAYLQLTTGRPASGPISEHRKKIVTSHECGHATNLEVMWNLAEKQNIPWHLPDKVNFVTLDPRGYFGGAMYSKDSGNEEHSFEKLFADLVCTYGGHSCEKKFYNIDGSWGITGDLGQATESANRAVQLMGMGPNTGKISLNGMYQSPSAKMRNNIDKDVEVLLKNSLTISDLITDVYADFNKEFTAKYAGLVGTGECLVQGDVFRKELKDWIERQPENKRREIAAVDEIILDTIKATKAGRKY